MQKRYDLLKVKIVLRYLPEKIIAFFAAVSLLLMLAAAGAAALDIGARELLGYLAVSLAYCLFAAMLFLLCRRLPERYMLPLIVLTAFCMRLPFALLPEQTQTSDFLLLYNAAGALAGGDISALTGSYFQMWGYQIPFVFYEALVLASGGGIALLRLLNAAWMSGTAGLCFLLARRAGGTRAGFVSGMLYAAYPGALAMASVLTNQHISLFFILLGVYLLIERGAFSEGGTPPSRLLWSVLAGLSLSFGNLMRPEAVLALASAVVAALVLLVRGAQGRKSLLVPLCAMLAAYLALGLAATAMTSGLAPDGIGNNRPEWKLVLGLDTESSGMYSDENAFILEIENDAARHEAAREVISESLAGCESIPAFLWQKLKLFWGAREDLGYVEGGLPFGEAAVLSGERAAFLLMTALAMYGCVVLLRRRAGAVELLLMCLVAANFLCYLVIEIQPRYRMFIMPAVFALAAAGYGQGREKRV